ncbi:MAG: hypothetical protein LQ344_004245 [Seirophora lacunosa]|nr:MAG: hypothetical protein LQ344_004245 [Seirophora lacunosa]
MNHGNVPVYVTRDHTDGSESPPPATSTSEQPPAATVTSLDVPDQSEFVTSDQSDFVRSDQSDSVTSDQSDFVTSDHTDGSEPPPPPTSVQPPAATVTSLDVPDQPNASVENPPTTNSEDPVSPSPQRPKPAEDTDDCSKCFIIYKYVDVYYPPAASSVTDCLTELDLAGVPTPTIPPGLKQYVYLRSHLGFRIYKLTDLRRREGHNAYIVVPELSAGNRCTKITEFTSLTFTFAPGELSTIQGPANITKEFNFGDLPCPPPDISSDAHWFYNPSFNPTQTYAPLVAPFSQLYDLHPAFKDCIVADNQGFDPAIALPPADAPTLPNLRGNFGPQIDGRGLPGLDRLKPREVPMVAHKVAYMPLETGSPALSDKDQGRD